MAEVDVRLMRLEDVESVHGIECACFAVPWSYKAFVREITQNMCARYMVLTEDGVPCAYAGMWLVLDEAHVTNIAVRPDRRRLGYGERVTRALIQLAADSGCTLMTLEARESNAPALALYKKLGFREAGIRKKYYPDNNENAVLMDLTELPEGDPDRDPFLVRED